MELSPTPQFLLGARSSPKCSTGPVGVAVVNSIDELERGRESYARRAWMDGYKSLSHADQVAPLGAEDLELLATTAYMLGRDDDYLSGLERAHHEYLDDGEAMRAVRCAFWLGVNLALRGEMGRATGWLGRAQRLLERQEHDCVERGYLLLPVVLQRAATGDHEGAYATAAEAAMIGERFGDRDLFALAVHEQGHALVRLGRVEEGLRLLDEAMVAVTAGELSPIVTGLIYCSVIDGCQAVYALRRARVDRRPDRVVRAAARHGGLHRPVPGAPRRDHGAGRCVAGRPGRGATGSPALRAGEEPVGRRPSVLPAG